jgi:hypothetical protein
MTFEVSIPQLQDPERTCDGLDHKKGVGTTQFCVDGFKTG